MVSSNNFLNARRYGWAVVGLCFVALAFTFTARNTLGVMMLVWGAEFGWSKSFLASGGSIALLAMAVAAPISGNILDRFGPRIIFITGLAAISVATLLLPLVSEPWQFVLVYCVIGGIGFGVLGLPQAAATTSRYVTENRGLAIGIAQSGGNAGQLVLIPLFAFLIIEIGWRGSYVLLGIAAVLLIPLILYLLRGAHGGAIAGAGGPAGETLGARLALLRASPSFWFMFAGFVICGFTTAGVIEVHLLAYAESCGLPAMGSATAYGVLCAFNVVGIILAGFLADKLHRPTLLAACYFIRAAVFVLLINVGDNLALLFVFAVIFGATNYATMPIIASLVASNIGVRVMGLTLGLMLGGHWLGAAIGAFIGGTLFDLTQRYEELWLVAIAFAVLAGLLALAVNDRRAAPAAPAIAAA